MENALMYDLFFFVVRLAAEVGGVPDVARLFEGLHNAYGRRIARLVENKLRFHIKATHNY